jgi:hypothetical protein
MAKVPVCGGEGAQGVGGEGYAHGHAFDFGSVGAAQHPSAEGKGEMDGRQAAGSKAAVGDGEGAMARGKGRLGGFWPARTIKRCVPLSVQALFEFVLRVCMFADSRLRASVSAWYERTLG